MARACRRQRSQFLAVLCYWLALGDAYAAGGCGGCEYGGVCDGEFVRDDHIEATRGDHPGECATSGEQAFHSGAVSVSILGCLVTAHCIIFALTYGLAREKL